MKPLAKWQIGILVILLILVAGTALVYFWPAPSSEETPAVELTNTLILGSLTNLGLTDVLIDKTDGQVLIRYNEPRDFANRSSVFAVAANYAPFTNQIVLQVFDNFEPKEEIIANTTRALEYADGQISETQFMQSLTVSKLQ